jgi:hypothetical protein
VVAAGGVKDYAADLPRLAGASLGITLAAGERKVQDLCIAG